MNKNILLLCTFWIQLCLLSGQNVLTGKIADDINNPVAYAHIHFASPDTILVSDINGAFTLTVPDGDVDLFITHIEYDTLYKSISISKDTLLQFEMNNRNIRFKEVAIYGVRSKPGTPIPYVEIQHAELNENNFGQDMPVLLQNTISAVSTSDAGNGVGYTGIRIRGSDATRVNVTINGVPFNDAESAQSYWVDIPDIATSADIVQVQRGIGFSTNGAGELGASINIFTNELKEETSATVSSTLGSFDLFRTNLMFSSGRMKKHWFLEGSGSYINSGGYIDRSFANLRSVFLTLGYQSNNYKSVFNLISGKEKTYQSWGGVPKDSLETNRTFNPYTYPNQTDNYNQTHFQWHHNLFFANSSNLNIAFNYTMGKGYYEQLEEGQELTAFGISPVALSDTVIQYADLITQKWLDNDFYGIITDYKFKINTKNKIILGGAYFNYSGNHFDQIIWAEYGNTGVPPYIYSDDSANKQDANVFVQWKYKPANTFEIISDVQWRYINYVFNGFDIELNTIPQIQQYNFINPKIGMYWNINRQVEIYAYLGYTSKEPNRDDFVNSTSISRPLPEKLLNAETGVKYNIIGWNIQPNLFLMRYSNQLVLDGRINDVGEYTRVNVPQSYRTGLELSVSKTIWSRITCFVYASTSINKIKSYTQYIDNWDTGGQIAITYNNTDVAFSPGTTAGLNLHYKLIDKYHLSAGDFSSQIRINSRYVGKQFIDNTSAVERSLEPYWVQDAALHLTLKSNADVAYQADIMISNFTNALYSSNAWVYQYYFDNSLTELNGYFPQAGIACYVKFSVHF